MECQVTLRVARHPAQDGKRFSEYRVSLEERMTVLDALFRAQREMDGSLGFRCSCRVGMCGSCAVNINRIPRLACTTLVRNLKSDVVTVEPLPHYQVVKDVAVSLAPFFEQWRRARPAFRPRNAGASTLALIGKDSRFRQLAPAKRDCITCGACYAACSITGMNPRYLGPAAINKAFLRLLDPRDAGGEDRLKILDRSLDGVWRCHTQFNCTAVCPRGIDLTDSIVRIKRALLRPGRLFPS
ncbi:MAG TPA: succinate dehydrogenase/fumarate reductase iron-sulfur subunit [Candidatus Acidoferrales bacterium]|nr:succinate dehydrogenase/fumarate reductase iron-sulfur subunit [Candidatus Acidoferrales bacterium]